MFNYNLSKEKQKLYENIIWSVSDLVKKALDEDLIITASMRKDDANLNDQLVIELRNRLKDGLVKFRFRKMDDTMRDARGTCHYDTIKLEIPEFEEWDPDYTPVVLSNPYVVRYFDLDKKQWRSCDVDRLKLILDE